jgi:redox-sensitive bicupin YhaK (pirin superfamily)
MSNLEARSSVELVVEPKAKDLGEFTVRRVLPSAERQMVGPFIFFDHMGPAEFPPGKGVQVRPHPHIGIATITYLFEGEIVHRDDLGYTQTIYPGAVNLMTAGRGIVHSERAGDDLDTTSRLHGIQSWMALPADQQECDPAFEHYPVDSLPRLDHEGVAVTVIIGSAYGYESPVAVRASMLYLELVMPAGSGITLPDDFAELGAYIVEGKLGIDDRELSSGSMAVFNAGSKPHITALTECRVMVVGGENMGERHIWWNFVSTSMERIEQAKADWRDKRFGKVAGDDEFIPLP